MSERKRPIVWTIAGSDSGGGAGLQADARAVSALGAFPTSIVTAVTAQSPAAVRAIHYVPEVIVAAQIEALRAELPPAAVKIGMSGTASAVRAIAAALSGVPAPIVCDPVMVSTSGARLANEEAIAELKHSLFPRCHLVTPNLAEAEALVDHKLSAPDAVEEAALEILGLGARSVLVKGGPAGGPECADLCEDFWTDGRERAWLVSPRRAGVVTHGTGCALSSAIAAGLARGESALDAIVLAKAFVNRGLRLAYPVGHARAPILFHATWPEEAVPDDFPWLTPSHEPAAARPRFAPFTPGFYPIVDTAAWVKRLGALGVRTIQLRNKTLRGEALEREVRDAVREAKERGISLFVNDYWDLAMRHEAFGVHLGQEDLASADLAGIARAGLRLGVSTHCPTEVARAHAIRPSYVAIGPIFATTAKPMRFAPQGLEGFARWRALLGYPLVAIGGIPLERGAELRRLGADGIAVISDVTRSEDIARRVAGWLDLFA